MEMRISDAVARRASFAGVRPSGRAASCPVCPPSEVVPRVRKISCERQRSAPHPRCLLAPRTRSAVVARCKGKVQGERAPEGKHGNGAGGETEVEYPVVLRVYNLDRYGWAPAGAKLLKKEVDGIYHVAVAVHQCEYWFDHQVNQQDLHDVEFAFGFGPSYVYDMGKTKLTRKEIESFVFGPMKDKYHVETYDCFYHNCHHFANDVCLHLTGRRIPQWCIDHGEQGLSELGEANAAVTRFVANKIARIMMVSWGKYSKERFVEKNKLTGTMPRNEPTGSGGAVEVSLPPPSQG